MTIQQASIANTEHFALKVELYYNEFFWIMESLLVFDIFNFLMGSFVNIILHTKPKTTDSVNIVIWRIKTKGCVYDLFLD